MQGGILIRRVYSTIILFSVVVLILSTGLLLCGLARELIQYEVGRLIIGLIILFDLNDHRAMFNLKIFHHEKNFHFMVNPTQILTLTLTLTLTLALTLTLTVTLTLILILTLALTLTLT